MNPIKIPENASLVRTVELQLTTLLREGDTGRLLCAFSGGADSAVLLSVLQYLAPRLGLKIRAMHVHHGIRGEEADRDEIFCRRFCAERGIPYVMARVDVPKEAESTGRGLEETARELRYRELERMRDTSELIATAHNATDNAETMLFHLIRGSGLRGMAGIPPRRDPVIRPLLSCSREEIRSFADETGIPYVEDSSNSDPTYARNRIRLHLLPEIAAINPSFAATMSRDAELIRQDIRFIDGFAEAERNVFLQRTGSQIGYPLERYRSLDPAIGSRVLTLLYESACLATATDTVALQFPHIQALMRLAEIAKPHSGLDLPSGMGARIENGTLWIFRKSNSSGTVSDPFHCALAPGLNCFSNLSCRIFLQLPGESGPEVSDPEYRYVYSARITLETAQSPLCIRNREPGDAYRAFGMTKTVRRRMSEKQIPLDERKRLPVFCDRDGPIWIPGFPVADRSAARNEVNDAAVLYYCQYQE